MFIAFLIATTILVIAALMPLISHQGWVVRAFDFPRLQIFTLLVALIALELILLDLSQTSTRVLLGLGVVGLANEAWWMVRYSPLYPKEVSSATEADDNRRIRILIANVFMPNRDADSLLAVVRDSDPDILVALESNAWWQKRLDTLEPDYPYSVKCPLENLYGMHVYSRLPLSRSQVEYLVEQDKPSIHTVARLRSGHEVTLHCLHPAPPSPTENVESAQRDAELLVVARSVADCETPIIVTGDLNDVAWSASTRKFRKISGLLDPRIGRGMFNTYHAKHWFLRWPLDHLFHSHHFTLRSIRRRGGYGSDHFALVTELVFKGDGYEQQQGLDADGEERAWAKAKHREEGVKKDDVPRPKKP